MVGCIPLLNRNIKRALVFDIGGGSTEISLARVTNSGKTFIEGFVSLPYGVVTISVAFPSQDMTALAYDETMADWRTHDGIDIEAKYGAVVSAMASGTVTKVYYDDLYGTTVVTEREDGLRCTYANLESIPSVNVGDQVSVGDTIGSVGESAGCEAAQESHLHLSVAASGQSVSPLD